MYLKIKKILSSNNRFQIIFLTIFMLIFILIATGYSAECFKLSEQPKETGLLIDNGFISLFISNYMQLTPVLKDSLNKLGLVSHADDSCASFYIQIEDYNICHFIPDIENYHKSVINDQFGKGWRIILNAKTASAELFDIKMTLSLYFYERFPTAIFTQVAYTNMGKESIQIQRLVNNHFTLDRTLVDLNALSWDFASYQGVSLNWGDDYGLIRTLPDIDRENFLGKTVLENGQCTGGGTPLIDLWMPQCGIALASAEPEPQWISMPVKGNKANCVEIALVEPVDTNPGYDTILDEGESIISIKTAIILHRLDFYEPLNILGHILRKQGVLIPEKSPDPVYMPYWKSWGLGMEFTQKQIFSNLETLKKVGVFWANLDDGWFDWYGDWKPNQAMGKFPNGESDMIEFVRKVHKKGFKTSIWWYPQGVSPESDLAKDHPDWLVQNEDGSFAKDTRGLFYLCPIHAPCIAFAEKMTDKILSEWHYDGLYIDTDALNCTPPCFNKAHHHATPLESFQNQKNFYKAIYNKAQELKPECPVELCACAMPHDPYKMPYYNISTTSDPTSLKQVRRRVKIEKALHGPTYCVGDCYQIPMNEWDGYSVPESFESAMGTGAQVTTYFNELTDKQIKKWKKWIKRSNQLRLSSGGYLNLYDIAWDKPETHVVQKNNIYYYAFYAENWSRRAGITLRGLDENQDYNVRDYVNDVSLGVIHGSDPVMKTAFKEFLLIEVTPVD